jgi:hypothetical protein
MIKRDILRCKYLKSIILSISNCLLFPINKKYYSQSLLKKFKGKFYSHPQKYFKIALKLCGGNCPNQTAHKYTKINGFMSIL